MWRSEKYHVECIIYACVTIEPIISDVGTLSIIALWGLAPLTQFNNFQLHVIVIPFMIEPLHSHNMFNCDTKQGGTWPNDTPRYNNECDTLWNIMLNASLMLVSQLS